jgi:hypothetical protein
MNSLLNFTHPDVTFIAPKEKKQAEKPKSKVTSANPFDLLGDE